MRFRIRLVMLLGILFLSMKAQAAPVLVVNGVGILTGARDIHLQVNLIDLGFWNVDFVDGTCAQVFGVCDIDHFPIRQQDLFAASEALSKTIFLDSAAGQFDSSPNLTNGCQGAGVQTCTVLMPDIIFFGPVLSTAGPRNLQGAGECLAVSCVVGFQTTQLDLDLSADPTRVWGRWTRVSVPEPTTLDSVWIGLLAIGALRFRRRNDFRD